MNKGYVYILRNAAMPGLVKVGRTSRHTLIRANELYQTGVPLPFECVESLYSPDCNELEGIVHDALSDHRVSQEREFFKCSEKEAVEALYRGIGHQIDKFLDQFLPPGMTVNFGVEGEEPEGEASSHLTVVK